MAKFAMEKNYLTCNSLGFAEKSERRLNVMQFCQIYFFKRLQINCQFSRRVMQNRPEKYLHTKKIWHQYLDN